MFGKTDEKSLVDDFSSKLTPTSYIWSGSNANLSVGYFWEQGYAGVKYANTVLSYIDKVQGLDEATKNTYKGRAYFHRAYHYSHLVFQFGDIPLVTKNLEVPKQNYKSTKMSAVLDMLVGDMEKHDVLLQKKCTPF